jgi:hypothetical protein
VIGSNLRQRFQEAPPSIDLKRKPNLIPTNATPSWIKFGEMAMQVTSVPGRPTWEGNQIPPPSVDFKRKFAMKDMAQSTVWSEA